MALTVPTNEVSVSTKNSSARPKFDADNLPNKNSQEAMMYSIRQGAIGGLYGFVGSTTFSLLANRFCKTVTNSCYFNFNF